MKFLEKLLAGTEVEWKTLGDEQFIEIANSGRRPVKASERIPGAIPYYGANNIQDYVEGFTHNGVYVLVAEDGTASLENYSIQWAVGKFWANNHVHVLRGTNLVDSRFIFHYLQIVNFIPFLSGGDRAKLTKAKLLEIQIPIPPLSVQKEIVRILDTFTQLTAELTAELTARKKQYEYFRNALLSFPQKENKNHLSELSGGVIWKSLGEVVTIKNGKDYKNLKFGNVPVYGSGGIMTFINTFVYDKPSVLIPRKGSLKNLFYVDIPFWTVDTIFWTDININIIEPKFVFYFLQTQQLEKLNMAGGVPSLTQSVLNKIQIPIPPLEEQARIVSILDQFDTLTASISEGLPKEIALRKQQYAYYRDMLLTF